MIMKTDEDDEFDFVEQFAKRNESPTRPDLDPYGALVRNQAIEEVARAIEQFEGAFGRTTVESFAVFVRGMKR